MTNHKGKSLFTKRRLILTGKKVYVKTSIANSFVYDYGFLGTRKCLPTMFFIIFTSEIALCRLMKFKGLLQAVSYP